MAKKKNSKEEEVEKIRYNAYCTNFRCRKIHNTNNIDEVVSKCECGTKLTWNDHRELKTLKV
jgi:hypothetical protein